MRLINTRTCEFEEFFDRLLPSYVILSHRWQRREASYQDFRDRQGDEGLEFRKILGFCKFAKAQTPPHEYVWIDTCCIDKRNSSELTESINSMYRWYENAHTCFVYLQDLPSKKDADDQERRIAFQKSEWFRRGWTLQELLAPSKVIFCDQAWDVCGNKNGLSEEIEEITGIAQPFLEGRYNIRRASVAMRMSWAAKRETTKLEDEAYCLLGLFDVNIPLLYGEKRKAFMRLQEEILKRSDDESIFAWKARLPQWGMLAPSPKAFQYSGKIVNFKLAPEQRMPYEMTNKGLKFRSASDTSASDNIDRSTREPMGYADHVVELGCFFGKKHVTISEHPGAEQLWEDDPIAIELKRFGPTWKRIGCNTFCQSLMINSDRGKRPNGSYYGRGVQRTYFVEQPVAVDDDGGDLF